MCSSFPGLLIGRTAVHSGKDPAFVAYDQFLSTGILQPLSRGEVRCGSVSVIRRCPLNVRFARKRTRLGDLWARRYNDLVGENIELRRNCKPEGVGGLAIDHQIEPGRLLDWPPCTFEIDRAIRGVTLALSACRRPLHRRLSESDEKPTVSPQ